jgi:hypothetical protein
MIAVAAFAGAGAAPLGFDMASKLEHKFYLW